MKVEPILQEIEDVKDRLAERAGGLTQFLAQMEQRANRHAHSGPVVNSPEELAARVRHREATEPPMPKFEPYRVHNPIIAEIHRTREKLYRERKRSGYQAVQPRAEESSFALHDKPRRKP